MTPKLTVAVSTALKRYETAREATTEFRRKNGMKYATMSPEQLSQLSACHAEEDIAARRVAAALEVAVAMGMFDLSEAPKIRHFLNEREGTIMCGAPYVYGTVTTFAHEVTCDACSK